MYVNKPGGDNFSGSVQRFLRRLLAQVSDLRNLIPGYADVRLKSRFSATVNYRTVTDYEVEHGKRDTWKVMRESEIELSEQLKRADCST